MNMVQLGYWLAGLLIAMVAVIHGARILQRVRDTRLNDGGAEAEPAAGYN
jgi:hypothetical protein